MVGQLHALVFAGGSVFGLAAADAVAAKLSQDQVGLHLKPGAPAIPIVPAAVLHDLANGGDKDWGLEPPYRRLGFEALANAGPEFELGSVGAAVDLHDVITVEMQLVQHGSAHSHLSLQR